MAKAFAIVTGASSGIGRELARICAANGFDLLIVADEPKIMEVAIEFKNQGIDVTAVQADLSTTDGVDKVYKMAAGRSVDALLANAGIGLKDSFLNQNFDEVRKVIDTNVIGTLYLLQKFGRDMRTGGEGRILITGSIAGFVPGAYHAVYNASKAFIDSFSYALRQELKEEGHENITVTCLMPGATETEFFDRADLRDTKLGQVSKDNPADVAKTGFDAMMKGEGSVVHGFMNKVQSVVAGFAPQGIMAAVHDKLAKPGSAQK